mmetsp:Transcript_9217/g.30415  ORF Transcript_9217/g.30415 Transcript_9217/m.30415 type:complete len:201 (+) Transcript_9217:28-630(+)
MVLLQVRLLGERAGGFGGDGEVFELAAAAFGVWPEHANVEGLWRVSPEPLVEVARAADGGSAERYDDVAAAQAALLGRAARNHLRDEQGASLDCSQGGVAPLAKLCKHCRIQLQQLESEIRARDMAVHAELPHDMQRFIDRDGERNGVRASRFERRHSDTFALKIYQRPSAVARRDCGVRLQVLDALPSEADVRRFAVRA